MFLGHTSVSGVFAGGKKSPEYKEKHRYSQDPAGNGNKCGIFDHCAVWVTP